MRFNSSEHKELNAGRYILRRVTLKATGEQHWVEVKRSWDTLYYRTDGEWHRSVMAALRASSLTL